MKQRYFKSTSVVLNVSQKNIYFWKVRVSFVFETIAVIPSGFSGLTLHAGLTLKTSFLCFLLALTQFYLNES